MEELTGIWGSRIFRLEFKVLGENRQTINKIRAHRADQTCVQKKSDVYLSQRWSVIVHLSRVIYNTLTLPQRRHTHVLLVC